MTKLLTCVAALVIGRVALEHHQTVVFAICGAVFIVSFVRLTAPRSRS